jgi:hypothetical protein
MTAATSYRLCEIITDLVNCRASVVRRHGGTSLAATACTPSSLSWSSRLRYSASRTPGSIVFVLGRATETGGHGVLARGGAALQSPGFIRVRSQR